MMTWKGEKLVTVKDFIMKGINQCGCQEEAQEFMRLYRIENPRADENLDFMICYYNVEEMGRIQSWFDIKQHSFADRLLASH